MTKQQTIDAISKLSSFDIDNDDALGIAIEVIASFGFVRESDVHSRVVQFLHTCVNRYLWTWESLGCEPPGPRPAMDAVETWLQTGVFTEGFAEFCFPVTPIREGEPVFDCDEPALRDLAGACSRVAYFCKTRKVTDAAMVLENLFWADAEGLQANDEVGLIEWLSTTGLNIAWPESQA